MSCLDKLSRNLCNSNENCLWKGLFCNPTVNANQEEYSTCINTPYQNGLCVLGNEHYCKEFSKNDCGNIVGCTWENNICNINDNGNICSSLTGSTLCGTHRMCDYDTTKNTCSHVGDNCESYPLYYDLSKMTTRETCENNTIEFCNGNINSYTLSECDDGTWTTITGSWDKANNTCTSMQGGNKINDICSTFPELCRANKVSGNEIATSLIYGKPNVNCLQHGNQQSCLSETITPAGGNTINLCSYQGNTCGFNPVYQNYIKFYNNAPTCEQINIPICSQYTKNPILCEQLGGYCETGSQDKIFTKDNCGNKWVNRCSYNAVSDTCTIPLQLYKTNTQTLKHGSVKTIAIVSNSTLVGIKNTKGTSSFVPFKQKATSPNNIYIKLNNSTNVKIASNTNQLVTSNFDYDFLEVKATNISDYILSGTFILETDSDTQIVHIKNKQTGYSVPIYTQINRHREIPRNMAPIIMLNGKWAIYYEDDVSHIDSNVLNTFPDTQKPKKPVTYILAWVFGALLLAVILFFIIRKYKNRKSKN